MDDVTQKRLAKLKKIRNRKDLKLKKSGYLKDTFTTFGGDERELRLRYYQIQGVLHLLAVSRFVLGDGTGLGKTLQSIAALCYTWDRNPNVKALVLTNKSAVPQWVGEFSKFTSGVNAILCRGTPKQRQKAYDEFNASKGPTVLVLSLIHI